MAKYTMELRKIQARFYEAMQDYPIFDENYRETLNDKIYHACKMREIGFETPELFLEQLAYWMDLHMPDYNWQYKANLIELTPLQRSQIMETMNRIKNYDENSNRNNLRESNRDLTSESENENSQSGSQIQQSSESNNATTENMKNASKVGESNESNITKNEQVQNANKIENSNENSTNKNEANSNESQVSHNKEEGSNTTDNNENTNNTSVSSQENENKAFHGDFPQANLNNTDDTGYYTTEDRDKGKSKDETIDNSNTVGQTVEASQNETTGEVQNTSNSVGNSEANRESSSQSSENLNNIENGEGQRKVESSSSDTENSIQTVDGGKEANTQTQNQQNQIGKNSETVNENNNESESMVEGKMGNEAETEIKSKFTGDGYSDFELLDQYRKAFVNVDNQIIRALKRDLFMNIW